MKITKMFAMALLGLALVAHPAEARRGRALATAAAVGITAAALSHHHDYYARGYYGGWWGPGYTAPLGYYDPYYTSYYRTPQVYPRSGAPAIAGAASFIDEGAFRNYRDAAGNFIGRVPLSQIPAGSW